MPWSCSQSLWPSSVSSTSRRSSTDYSPSLSNPVCIHSSWAVEAEAGDLHERRKDNSAIESVMKVRLTVDQQPLSREGGFWGRVGNEAWGAGVGQSVKESLLEKRWKGGSYTSLSDRKVADVWNLLAVTGSCWLFSWWWPFWLHGIVALICIHLMAMFSGIYCHLYLFWDLSTHLSIYWLDYLFLWSSLISALCVFLAFSVYRDWGTAGRSPPPSRILTFAGQGFLAPCSCIVIHACSLSC